MKKTLTVATLLFLLTITYADIHYKQTFFLTLQLSGLYEQMPKVKDAESFISPLSQSEPGDEIANDSSERVHLRRQVQIQRIIIISISIILLLLMVMYILIIKNLRYRYRITMIDKDNLTLQHKKVKEESDYLQKNLELKDRQLMEKAFYMIQKNELISEIADQLIDIKKKLPDDCKNVLNRLEYTLTHESDKKIWSEFEVRFKETHQEFYKNLTEKYPNLTPNEKKLATFLRMNLSTKDIATITFQTPDSIKIARSRLRKKLGLGSSENIISFLEKIG